MAPAPATRPYRDFMTPALHRRFARASLFSFGICFAIAIWMSHWDSYIWTWFPIGPAGLRALLLFISSLVIYVLRVAQWHVGSRNTEKPIETFTKYALRADTLRTLAFYTFSAFFYAEIYLWSRSTPEKMGLTDPGKLHERIRLNERPYFLRCMLLCVAAVQTGVHLWYDYDKISLPITKLRQDGKTPEASTVPKSTESPFGSYAKLLPANKDIPKIFKDYSIRTFASFVGGMALYFTLIRPYAWPWWYGFVRSFVSLAKSPKPSGLAPFSDLAFKVFSQSMLMTLLWETTNSAFSLFIAQEPLKAGKPITDDSQDPNGSLLTGLKSKKAEVKSIALWELALITLRFPDRRKQVYNETTDRAKGPALKQIVQVCLAEITNIGNRIDAIQGIAPKPSQDTAKPQSPPVQLVPRISQPLKQDPVAGAGAPPSSKLQLIESTASKIAQSYSSPANVQNAHAAELIKKGERKAIEGAQKARQTVSNLGLKRYWIEFVESNLGTPFRNYIRRTANVVVLGAPFSREAAISYAATALVNLAVQSIKEDTLGHTQKEIAGIVRAFTTTIQKVEAFIKGLVGERDAKTEVPEVQEVLEILKDGQSKVLGAFGEYLEGLGLSRTEIREAKTVATQPGVRSAA